MKYRLQHVLVHLKAGNLMLVPVETLYTEGRSRLLYRVLSLRCDCSRNH